MKKAFVCYVDMDGVLNLFESDKNARINMWNPGYFTDIPTREGMNDVLIRINKIASVVILSKVIYRIGVTKEKNVFLSRNYSSSAYDDVIYIPYDRSKSDYMYPYFPSMLVDDNEGNISECEKKGCHGLFLSDIKISQKYPNAKSPEDIYSFFEELIKKL